MRVTNWLPALLYWRKNKILNLEKRIAALEATTAPAADLTIIRHYVSPGHLDDEIFCLCDDDGNQWTRQPNETEQELKDRATAEVKRNAWGVAILTMKVVVKVFTC